MKTYPNINAHLILKRHNQWRRGKEMEPTDPKLLGLAIDLILLEHAALKKAVEHVACSKMFGLDPVKVARECLLKIAKRKGLTTDACRNKRK